MFARLGPELQNGEESPVRRNEMLLMHLNIPYKDDICNGEICNLVLTTDGLLITVKMV